MKTPNIKLKKCSTMAIRWLYKTEETYPKFYEDFILYTDNMYYKKICEILCLKQVHQIDCNYMLSPSLYYNKILWNGESWNYGIDNKIDAAKIVLEKEYEEYLIKKLAGLE